MATTDLSKKFSDLRIDFRNNVAIEAGSRVHEALGRNVICSVIDEINYRLEKDAAKAAHELVEAIHRRMKSRFRRKNSNPSMLIIISSARAENDYLTSYIRKYKDDDDVRVYDFAWWDVVGAVKMKYSGVKFIVDVGDALTSPRILDDEDEAAKIPASRIIRPPIEHRKEFERDIVGAIRDIAGVATGRSTKLFPQMVDLLNILDDELDRPTKSDNIPLSVSGSTEIRDCLIPNTLLTVRGGALAPKRHPSAARYLHLDMSTGAQDALGFCMVHQSGEKEVNKLDNITGSVARGMMPCYEIDMCFRIIRDVGGNEIDFGKIRSFIWWLREVGFNIAMVSCDLLHMSTEMRTILKRGGFNTCYTSVDRKKDAYITFKHAVLEGRVKSHESDYLLLELGNLEDGVDMIDHPDLFPPAMIDGTMQYDLKGSKDMADGAAGAVFVAETAGKSNFVMGADERLEMMRELNKNRGAKTSMNIQPPTF
jgi:hypothetical protein